LWHSSRLGSGAADDLANFHANAISRHLTLTPAVSPPFASSLSSCQHIQRRTADECMSASKDSIVAMPADSLSITIVAFLVPLATYCLFKLTMANGAKDPPAASHWFPLLSHTRTFALGDITLASAFLYAHYFLHTHHGPRN
jgi:hypothetical protein